MAAKGLNTSFSISFSLKNSHLVSTKTFINAFCYFFRLKYSLFIKKTLNFSVLNQPLASPTIFSTQNCYFQELNFRQNNSKMFLTVWRSRGNCQCEVLGARFPYLLGEGAGAHLTTPVPPTGNGGSKRRWTFSLYLQQLKKKFLSG